MGISDDIDADSRVTLRKIEAAGFLVSVHRMRDYVYCHAVPAVDPASALHLTRVDGGDGPAQVAACVAALARSVCLDVDDGGADSDLFCSDAGGSGSPF